MTLYVSWGGSGTTDSLRNAAQQAHDSDTALVYLGIVDDQTFGDVDGATMEMLLEELDFLLRTQLVGVTRQIGAPDLATSVEIRRGSVSDAIRGVSAKMGVKSALIGGPLPSSHEADRDSAVAELSQSSGVQLTLV